MPSSAHLIGLPGLTARSFALGALMGAAMLASPLAAARAADTVSSAAFQLAQTSMPQSSGAPQSQAGAAMKGETVEQRIATLHTELKITPDEDAKWDDVARAMRQNAAAMDKLVTESQTTPRGSLTAVEDLRMYQKFAQAHVDGLKNLISSFSSLYSAMPESQKKVADSVFQAAHQTSAGQTG
jgi:protein CpxP